MAQHLSGQQGIRRIRVGGGDLSDLAQCIHPLGGVGGVFSRAPAASMASLASSGQSAATAGSVIRNTATSIKKRLRMGHLLRSTGSIYHALSGGPNWSAGKLRPDSFIR